MNPTHKTFGTQQPRPPWVPLFPMTYGGRYEFEYHDAVTTVACALVIPQESIGLLDTADSRGETERSR